MPLVKCPDCSASISSLSTTYIRCGRPMQAGELREAGIPSAPANEDATDPLGPAENIPDEMLRPAALLCVQNRAASTSLVQRQLVIGYERATRLVNELFRLGVIGSPRGSKPRQILATLEQVDGMLGSAEPEAHGAQDQAVVRDAVRRRAGRDSELYEILGDLCARSRSSRFWAPTLCRRRMHLASP